MTLVIGQILHNNRYRVDGVLGQGGMGAVYRAWDLTLDTGVAIKENLDYSPEAQKQFIHEAQIVARLSHPALPRVTDYFFITNQGQYLVMDYVAGEDLDQMLTRQGALPEAQVLNWITQVCDALAYLHNQPSPIIHRDIKPANIKICPDGRAVLVDFGIAKVYDPHLATTIGAKAVTPGYSPPEQYGGSPTDTRSDIYALGATLYHLLTGQKPPESVQRAVGFATLPPPRQLNQHISPNVEGAVLKAIEVSTDRRFQSVTELRAALSGAAVPAGRTSLQPGQTTPAAQPAGVVQPVSSPRAAKRTATQVRAAGRKEERSNRLWIGLLGGALLLAILLGGGVFLVAKYLSERQATPTPVVGIGQVSEKPSPTPLPATPPIIQPTNPPGPVPTRLPTQPPAPQPGDCASPDLLCVGFVTDVEKMPDGSFNQAAWQGIQRAEKELGARIKFIESDAAEDYPRNISSLVQAQFDIIVTVGFAMEQVTATAALKYPETLFIGVDQTQAEVLPNLVNLIFPEDQAGFLVGFLAAMLSRNGMIGAVLGTDAIPPVWRYGEGFRAGARYANPDLQVIILYHNEVEMSLSFNDQPWGTKAAMDIIAKGADVVFGAGGQTGNGALIGALKMGVYCIGVDVDQFLTFPEAQPCLLTSAVKRIDHGVFELIVLAYKKAFPSGSYLGQAGYAPFHNYEDTIPADIKAKLQALAQALWDGSLVTNVPESKP